MTASAATKESRNASSHGQAFQFYWIVNLRERQIEVYTDPSGPAESPDYRQRQDCGAGDEMPVVLDGKEIGRIAVRDILP